MKRGFTSAFAGILAAALAFGTATAQQRAIAIGTGGTGGVYYPIGGALANLISKTFPNMQATAQVTGGSVDNLKLINSGQSELAFSMADAALDAFNGVDKFKGTKVPLRTLMVLYPNIMHVVSIEGTGVNTLADLKGRPVGLWLGGDEAEFIAMLASVGMKLSDVRVVPQGFSVIPFLNGDYVLSEVTVYNELLEIEGAIRGKDTLQIISPGQFNSAIVSDMIVVTEQTAQRKRDELVRFLRASLKGWRYSIDHSDEAIDLVLAANRELKRDEQKKQLQAVSELMLKGTPPGDIGTMRVGDYENMIRILKQSGQLTRDVKPADVFDDGIWKLAKGSP